MPESDIQKFNYSFSSMQNIVESHASLEKKKFDYEILVSPFSY